ncbi:MAG: hypothetical protein AMJ73_05525 [candidate division Zixibacteria bacterium SM1_73]|nr:MAG: hypothetical protein AMJ73_05525 [candidate division Zixibacteria bacterium SM1_73]
MPKGHKLVQMSNSLPFWVKIPLLQHSSKMGHGGNSVSKNSLKKIKVTFKDQKGIIEQKPS